MEENLFNILSIKHIKESTEEIVDYIKSKKLVTIATPFDNESLPWLEDLDVSVVKIASCSIDDWPLLRKVCKINKRIILSTGGTSIEQLRDVYELFKKNKQQNDTLSKWIDRIVLGNESSEIKSVVDVKKILSPLVVPPTKDEEPDFYLDYGSDTSYHTITGKGECAA